MTPSTALTYTSRCSRRHRRPSRAIICLVDVSASGIMRRNASMPIVMNGRLKMSVSTSSHPTTSSMMSCMSSNAQVSRCRQAYANAKSPSVRRCFASQFHPVSRRSGVMESVATSSRSVQLPKRCSPSLMGSEPRWRDPKRRSEMSAAAMSDAGTSAAMMSATPNPRGCRARPASGVISARPWTVAADCRGHLSSGGADPCPSRATRRPLHTR